jgi:hypothetical protein
MYVCTCGCTQYDTRHEQGGVRKVADGGTKFNTTYVLEESTDLANVVGMNRDMEVVYDPMTSLFSDAMVSSVTSRGSRKFSTTF